MSSRIFLQLIEVNDYIPITFRQREGLTNFNLNLNFARHNNKISALEYVSGALPLRTENKALIHDRDNYLKNFGIYNILFYIFWAVFMVQNFALTFDFMVWAFRSKV